MWKANGKTTTLQLFLDSLSPKTEKLSLEEAMDLSRDRLTLELELINVPRQFVTGLIEHTISTESFTGHNNTFS
jgi:hypothetical protein